ncbi:MAG: flagellar hook-basal body complex protein [Synergistaceae bacterium]|nr:flagellar hook-basal body complex protein [Synergistaceae bacterium]
MLRSLFTAVTGVRAHQTMLDVTGNNISNANTTGFKKDNTIFADLMYQANKYASGAGDSRGGINPAQVGLGVSVSAIETIHTQGSGQYTGNTSDMMIQDKGFFVYQNGNQQIYSRSGACVLDANSDMVLSGSGYKLQGYQYEETPLDGYQQAASLSTVNVPLGQKIDAKATTQVDYQCNLDSRSSAYLPYGYADLRFNASAGWKGNVNGTARVPMGGNEYELSFTTSALSNTNDRIRMESLYNGGADGANSGTGANYLDLTFSNGGRETKLTFDMLNVGDVSSGDGLPVLSLPRIFRVEPAEEDGEPTYISTLNGDADADNGTPGTDTAGSVEGWLTSGMVFIDSSNLQEAVAGMTQDELDKLMPVYRFPGQTPPQYFAAQYDDNSGTLKIRTISFTGADGREVSTTNDGFRANYDALIAEEGTVKANPTVFTYNLKDNMNYTSFKLSGSPTVPYFNDDGEAQAAEPHKVEYNFVAEFNERTVDALNSDLSKTSSVMTLWYYGYSNADVQDDGTFADGAVERMHKLEANVFFNTDGTFDSVEWLDSDNSNAPLGYRIVAGSVLGADEDAGEVRPNFQIALGSATQTSSKTDTLRFKQAQNLDDPGELTNEGVWTTVGTTYQGGFHATKCTIYDDNGKEHTLEVNFKKITENRWRWEAFLVEKDEQSGEDVLANIRPTPSSGEIEFDGSGRISNAVDNTGENRRGDGNDRFPNAEVEITLPFSLDGQPNSVVTLNFGGGVGKGGENIDGVTQFASETTTKPIYQDGYTMGVLKNYSIAIDGVITGSYDNGINIPLYRVALATFANEQGLEKIGNTMFQATVNSGNANIDGATTNGKGSIMSQYLEMSNVDLTEEFTHLIIAQRGFQANTRVVTVSDQILEEVVNLKR